MIARHTGSSRLPALAFVGGLVVCGLACDAHQDDRDRTGYLGVATPISDFPRLDAGSAAPSPGTGGGSQGGAGSSDSGEFGGLIPVSGGDAGTPTVSTDAGPIGTFDPGGDAGARDSDAGTDDGGTPDAGSDSAVCLLFCP